MSSALTPTAPIDSARSVVEPLPSWLARNLVAARTALRWTQHQLAQRSRISRATIAQLEREGSDPRLSTVALLAEALLAGALHVSPLVLLMSVAELDCMQQLNGPSDAVESLRGLRTRPDESVAEVSLRSRALIPSASVAAGAAIGHAIGFGSGAATAAAWSCLLEQRSLGR